MIGTHLDSSGMSSGKSHLLRLLGESHTPSTQESLPENECIVHLAGARQLTHGTEVFHGF